MIKKIAYSTLLLFLFALPTTTFSHSYLEDSNPKNEAIIVDDLQEIQLFFNASIEPLSTFELLNEQEESIIIDEYTVDQDTIIGFLEEPLSNGTYIVNWRIIASDGHTSDGQFSFDVERPEEVVETPVEQPQDPETEEVKKSEEEIHVERIIEEEASPLASLLPLALIILGGISYILWHKRRRA